MGMQYLLKRKLNRKVVSENVKLVHIIKLVTVRELFSQKYKVHFARDEQLCVPGRRSMRVLVFNYRIPEQRMMRIGNFTI